MIICEDGSSDGTADTIRELAAHYPLQLLSSPGRKGYSRAVIDGIRASKAEYVLCIDGDGQCDPQSLVEMVRRIDGYDVVLGWRNPRHDSRFRLFISAWFKCLYEALFPVRLKDPSYACMLMRRSVVDSLKAQPLGLLKQGLFWEMNARIAALGARVVEIPVRHRFRVSGRTRVYKLVTLPKLALEHVVALFSLRTELQCNQEHKAN
jgi:dolichol-phosphate mannosyltransferase